MARKSKSSTAEDLMDLIAMLPWWVGIALAISCYRVLHSHCHLPSALCLQRKARSKLVNWPPRPYGRALLPVVSTSCPSSAWQARPFSPCASAVAADFSEPPRPVPPRMPCRACHGGNSKRWSRKDFGVGAKTSRKLAGASLIHYFKTHHNIQPIRNYRLPI